MILEVNGQNVQHEHFEDVVALIKKRGTSLLLLVIDKDGFEKLRTSGASITLDESLHTTQVRKCTHVESPRQTTSNMYEQQHSKEM